MFLTTNFKLLTKSLFSLVDEMPVDKMIVGKMTRCQKLTDFPNAVFFQKVLIQFNCNMLPNTSINNILGTRKPLYLIPTLGLCYKTLQIL